MHIDLKKTFTQALHDGLRRQAITRPSEWAEHYRVIPDKLTKQSKPWSFRFSPWTREMHDAFIDPNIEQIVGQKAAQMGYTEAALNLCFYSIDIKRFSVLYVLPSQRPDAIGFSAARFDPALEESSHLQKLFSDTKNAQHKRSGSANLFIRGSRKRSHLVSMPVNVVLLDEVDEMTQENIPAVFERMMGQLTRFSFLLSTPTVPGKGISRYFEQSTQEQYFFPCPSCNRWITLKFPDCIEIIGERPNDPRLAESFLKCNQCGAKLPQDPEGKADMLCRGKWIPTYSDRSVRGFQINQLNNPVIPAKIIAEKYLKAQLNTSDEQEFYNSTLGEAHLPAGSQITDQDLDSCIGTYTMHDESNARSAYCTMGVDVGKHLHVEIVKWSFDTLASIDPNLCSNAQVIYQGKVTDFESLDLLMEKYKIRTCVIDANPERRKALEFANRFYKQAYMCFYVEGIGGKQIRVNDDALSVSVDRTSWLDLSLSRFKNQTIRLPKDTPLEYRSQIMSPKRIFKKDQNGNPVARYIHDEKDPDHYAHARTYCEIALNLSFASGGSQII